MSQGQEKGRGMGGEETVKEKQGRDGGRGDSEGAAGEGWGGEETVKERQERDGGRGDSEGEAGEGWEERRQ